MKIGNTSKHTCGLSVVYRSACAAGSGRTCPCSWILQQLPSLQAKYREACMKQPVDLMRLTQKLRTLVVCK